jgi:hypothetical protein
MMYVGICRFLHRGRGRDVRIERTEVERVGRWRLRRRRHGVHITLPLHGVEDLFTAPDLDPFSVDYETYAEKPGIEVIATALRVEGWRGPNATTLVLPVERIEPALERRTKDAVARYCRSAVEDIELELLRVRRHGFRTLLFGLAAVFVLNLAAQPILNTDDPFLAALSQGLQVASWVTLWLPINLLVYERWNYKRAADLYRAILTMDLTFEPHGAPRPGRAARSTAP